MTRTIALAAVLVFVPLPAFAHGGGLDANGGHHDRRRGGYHCHREPCFSRQRARREEPPPQRRDERSQRSQVPDTP